MEDVAVLLIPVLLAVLLIRALLLPIKFIFKLGIHIFCGFFCLWLLNSISSYTGILLPINTATVLTSGIFGIPGILVIVLLEYIPFFLGIGPGADLLFGSTFGGPFMSILIVFVPQVLVFSLLCTYIYRRTGNAYVGAFTVASMAAWIITGGSAML